jgi:antirestriction protein ArdC
MAYRNHRNAASRPSIYQTVTDRIISSLKAGVIPWEKPWKTPRYAGGPFPRNFYTGKPYRGINVLLLWSSEYGSPFWLTFKQAQAMKGSVRKGEHGTQIIFYKQLAEYATKDEEGTGEDERVPFVLCHYTVFNVEQCDGLTLPEISQADFVPEIDEDDLLRKHRCRMGEPPRAPSQQPHRVPRLLPALYRFRPHASAEPLCGCAALLQHLIP